MVRTIASLGLAFILLVAAGCGTSEDEAQSGAAQITPQPTVGTGTVRPSPAPVAGSPQPALPATVSNKDGRQVTITDVSRIIPLNGDIAEVIWALGLGDHVVATDTSATYPEAAKALPKIGYQRQLSAEGILSLRPSVIIGNENAGPPAVIEQLRGAGVPVVILTNVATPEGALTKIRSVGAALGLSERAARLVETTQAEVEAAQSLASKASTEPRVLFLYVRGAATQQIGGQGTAADALIATAGAVDAGTKAGIDGFKPLTPEALVTAQPDVLLLLTAGLESVGGVDGLLSLPGVAQTPAGKNRRIIHFEGQYLLGMGPRVGQVLMELTRALHPELR
jgi:iron complex transport system substrate-binding protein